MSVEISRSEERLSRATLNHHHAIVSVMEEMDAIDWYRARAEDTRTSRYARSCTTCAKRSSTPA